MQLTSGNGAVNPLSPQGRLTRDCMDWVAQKLPPGLPPSVRRDALLHAPDNLKPDFRKHLILRYQLGEFSQEDLEELRLRLFREACCQAASRVELMDRVYEMERWRYVPRFENGETFYMENLGYTYNTTYDPRKPRFEFQLQLEAAVLPPSRVTEQGMDYETQLNRLFLAPHWRYDSRTNTFTEISSSQWRDGSGVLHPNPGLVRGTTEKYSK